MIMPGAANWLHALKQRLRLLVLLRRSSSLASATPLALHRNIGVVAHIDAGKTTTTERILNLAGYIPAVGSVDDGTTVMDFLPQERERGITIQSAAITFGWAQPGIKPALDTLARVTLIDTPGHIDFTFEVARTLKVLDAAIVVVDAVAGVQAQTRTVWKQASHLPRVVFMNKMDRLAAVCAGASAAATRLKRSIDSVSQLAAGSQAADADSSLKAKLLPLQYLDTSNIDSMPAKDSKNALAPIDLIYGSEKAAASPGFRAARRELVETISEFNDEIMDAYLASVDAENGCGETAAMKLNGSTLAAAVRDAVHSCKIVPVLFGSAVRNYGVRELLDTVVSYLPAPKASPSSHKDSKIAILGGVCCAYVFKVTYDAQRAGYMAFVRVYHGTLMPRQLLRNVNVDKQERVQRILTVYASSTEETQSLHVGQIGLVVGLKNTRSGDILVNDGGDELWAQNLVGMPVSVPEPVVMRGVEAESDEQMKKVNEYLRRATYEDPSLVYKENTDTGQSVLCGMGELHLEVAADRVQRQVAGIKLNPPLISYRETVLKKLSWQCDESLSISVTPLRVSNRERKYRTDSAEDEFQPLAANQIEVAILPSANKLENAKSAHGLLQRVKSSITEAIEKCLKAGPNSGYPILGVHVKVIVSHDMVLGINTKPGNVGQLAAKHLFDLLLDSTTFAEPWMRIRVSSLSINNGSRNVATDVICRGGNIIDVDDDTMLACAPLQRLLGYANSLRCITGGTATLEMDLDGYYHCKAEAVKN